METRGSGKVVYWMREVVSWRSCDYFILRGVCSEGVGGRIKVEERMRVS